MIANKTNVREILNIFKDIAFFFQIGELLFIRDYDLIIGNTYLKNYCSRDTVLLCTVWKLSYNVVVQ